MIRLLNLRKRLMSKLRDAGASPDVLALVAEINSLTDNLLAGKDTDR